MTDKKSSTWRESWYSGWQKLKWALKFEKPKVMGGISMLKKSAISSRDKQAIFAKYRSRKNIKLLSAHILVLICVVVWLSMSVELKVLETSYHSHYFLVSIVHMWWTLALVPWWIWRRMVKKQIELEDEQQQQTPSLRKRKAPFKGLKVKGEATRDYIIATEYINFDHVRYGILSVIGLISGWTWYVSIPRTELAANTSIYQSSIAFVYIFSVLILKEKTKWYKTFSVFLCIGGVALVAFGSLEHSAMTPVSTMVDNEVQNNKIINEFVDASALQDLQELQNIELEIRDNHVEDLFGVDGGLDDDIQEVLLASADAPINSGADLADIRDVLNDIGVSAGTPINIENAGADLAEGVESYLEAIDNLPAVEVPIYPNLGAGADIVPTTRRLEPVELEDISLLGLVSLNQQTFGYVMVIISMLLYSLFEVAYKTCSYPSAASISVDHKGELTLESFGHPHLQVEGCRAIGIMGATSCLCLPFVFLWQVLGWEKFEWPTMFEWYLLTIIGLVDTLYNLLILLAIGLSSPLTVATGLLLSMPASMLLQYWFNSQPISFESIMGASLILLGFGFHVGGSRINYFIAMRRVTGVNGTIDLDNLQESDFSDELSDICMIEDEDIIEDTLFNLNESRLGSDEENTPSYGGFDGMITYNNNEGLIEEDNSSKTGINFSLHKEKGTFHMA